MVARLYFFFLLDCIKMNLWNLTRLVLLEYGHNWWTTPEIQLGNWKPVWKPALEERQKETQLLSAAATQHWRNFINIVTPAGSDCKSSGLITVISWTVTQKTAKNHWGFQTPCFYSGPFCSGLLWWLDNTWSGGCMYSVSGPSRDERQMMDGGWHEVRRGEMNVRDVEKKKHGDKSDDSQRWAWSRVW